MGSDRKKALTPATKRDAVRFMVKQRQLSVVRAARCAGLHRSAFCRAPKDWTVRDAKIISALAKVLENHPSRGFWMCHKLLKRQGHPWNHKRIYRVYERMNLHLRRPAKKRLPNHARVPLYVPRMPDTVWSADFVSDALGCGRRFRTFNIVDDFNREAVHIEIDTSIRSNCDLPDFLGPPIS